MISQTANRYRIAAKLGAAGLGAVCRIEDTTLKRTVAVLVVGLTLLAAPASGETPDSTGTVWADTLVISASRLREPKLRAPASVSLIDRAEIRDQPHFTPVDLARDVTGVDFASKGMMQHTLSVRGVRGVTSASMLVLADDRYTAIPVLDYNMPYTMSQTSDDIDRIEIVRGPGAAVYGPNTTQGVLHVITRSPFRSPGTSVSLMGGERNSWQGTLRHAGLAGENVAYRISAQVMRGQDWEYTDPVEIQEREEAIAEGASPDTLRIAARDPQIGHLRTDARLDWEAGDNTTLIFNSGLVNTDSAIDMINTTGAIQAKDWSYAYFQGRLQHKDLRANLLYNFGSTGDSYFLRTGEPAFDESRLFAAQVRHSVRLFDRSTVLYGGDFRHSEPRTDGRVNGRYEDDDIMNELGGYVTSRTALNSRLDLVAALRTDYHDRINDLAVSPRVGLVYEPREGHAFRLTYNRAYDSPGARDLFVDLKLDRIMPGQDMRLVAVPQDGFQFTRDCSGRYCMRSIFHPEGAAAVLPADATLMWPVLVEEGLVPSSVPAPDGSQVGTDLRSYDVAAGAFIPVTQINNLEQWGRNYLRSVETGYKGQFGARTEVFADLYWTEVDNWAMGLYGATPLVYFDEADLRQYLIDTGGLDPATAAAIAGQATQIPVGTVAPDGVESTDVFLCYRQEGKYIESRWGADVGIDVALTGEIKASIAYSWVSEAISGVPRNKGSLGLCYRSLLSGLDGGFRYRAVETFRVETGVYHGSVEGYSVFDVYVGHRFPGWGQTRVSLNAYNLFDNRHQEMIGAPDIGRLVMLKLQYSF